MDYQNYADNTFRALTEEAPANNCSVLLHENGVLVDAGCDCPGGWSAAKRVLEGLIGGRGQVGYTQTPVEGDLQMPAVELFLDDPKGAASHFTPEENGVFGVPAPEGYALGVSLQGRAPALNSAGHLVAAEGNSLFAAVLEAGGLAARAVHLLRGAGIEDVQWAWSSCPIAPMGPTAEETARERAALTPRHGTVSIWVRGEATAIRKALEDFSDFRLCVHELATACTYRSGTGNR